MSDERPEDTYDDDDVIPMNPEEHDEADATDDGANDG